MTQLPASPSRFVALPQNGESGCVVDFSTGKIVQTFLPKKGHTFYGHAASVEGGRLLLTSESDLEQHTGRLIVRDAQTFQTLREVDTYGTFPHDIKVSPDGRLVTVTNEGVLRDGKGDQFPFGYIRGKLESSVVQLDWRSGKLIRKLLSPVPNLCMAHLDMGSRGQIAVSSSPGQLVPGVERPYEGLGLVLIPGPEGRLVLPSPYDPVIRRMKGQALSLRLNEKYGIVGAASPLAGLVTFWDYTRPRFLKALEIPSAQGISVSSDSNSFLVSTGKGAFYTVGARSLEIESHSPPLQENHKNASHLLVARVALG
jgi:hypothetical protein